MTTMLEASTVAALVAVIRDYQQRTSAGILAISHDTVLLHPLGRPHPAPDSHRVIATRTPSSHGRGELAEMRRSDLDVTNGVVHVRRGVVRTNPVGAARRPEG
ncbi:MAG TPA: hypothetical protein VIY28_06615 [Pseudonocardiaceae bacterium]